MNPAEKKKVLRDIIRWQRIGCIVVKLSEILDISLKAALDLFYASRTCRRFHDENTGLYLFSDLYISQSAPPPKMMPLPKQILASGV